MISISYNIVKSLFGKLISAVMKAILRLVKESLSEYDSPGRTI